MAKGRVGRDRKVNIVGEESNAIRGKEGDDREEKRVGVEGQLDFVVNFCRGRPEGGSAGQQEGRGRRVETL